MIEQALREHLIAQEAVAQCLATYNGVPAVFNQEAPADNDYLWADGPQYCRVVFAVDLQGDPERTMGGTLAVDIMCHEDDRPPEEIEPVIRQFIHGYFFSNGTFTVSAQWKNSSYFTEPTSQVIGCTLTFDLLGFPILTTSTPDVIARINAWSASTLSGIHVINHDALPATAWKPTDDDSAIYWRLVNDNPAGWIPDTFQTIWRTATIKCHIFSRDNATAAIVAREITTRLHAAKRLLKADEAPIMVNRKNSADYGADPLRTGQVTIEATYGIIVHAGSDTMLEHIYYEEKE